MKLNDEVMRLPNELRHETVIGMTYLSALCQFALGIQVFAPNVLIIDEAGQLPLSQGICAGLIGAGSVLLFGDDKQMPPVFDAEISEQPLACSLFERARNTCPGSITNLAVTYRMNRSLCRAVSDTFYPELSSSQLVPASSNADATCSVPASGSTTVDAALAGDILSADESLIWVRTAGGYAREMNDREGEFVATLLAAAVRAGCDVAAVTPFRRQVAKIRNSLQRELGPGRQLPVIDTVERVQGITVDLIVFNLCSTDSAYLGAIASFLFSPNRLNVAVSRARSKAIVVGTGEFNRATPADFKGVQAQSIWRRFLEHMEYVVDLPDHCEPLPDGQS